MSGDNQTEILLKGRLNGQQRTRLKKLLNMMYKPSELAEEVGFNVRQVYRVYIPAGCPHERDERRRIWINGKAFREWAEEVYSKRELASNEAFCLTCKRPVKMIGATKKQEGRLVYYLCNCPNCGRRLSRIIEKKKRGVL
jgi:hypothetical protein